MKIRWRKEQIKDIKTKEHSRNSKLNNFYIVELHKLIIV